MHGVSFQVLLCSVCLLNLDGLRFEKFSSVSFLEPFPMLCAYNSSPSYMAMLYVMCFAFPENPKALAYSVHT